MATGTGTQDDPWQLKTPPGTSEYQMWKDEAADLPAIVWLRGRFGVYLPALLEALGRAEVTHDARNNRMRAL
jgi:hypothetical protein